MKSDLKVGQVRKLDSIKGIADSRLVTIAEIDSGDATCLVFLLNNMVEAATPRDVCIPQILAGSNYDLVLMSDYLSRVCLLYTSPSPRDRTRSRMPSSA